MSAVRWPEAVAAGISLLEVAVGPEIAEEAFAIAVGMDTFGAACRRADAKAKRRDSPELQRCRALLDDTVSLEAAWSSMQRARPTPAVTVKAIKQAVHEGGPGVLTEPSIKQKLQRCDHSALAELDRWLLKRGIAT
jgi:hypothetical protein